MITRLCTLWRCKPTSTGKAKLLCMTIWQHTMGQLLYEVSRKNYFTSSVDNSLSKWSKFFLHILWLTQHSGIIFDPQTLTLPRCICAQNLNFAVFASIPQIWRGASGVTYWLEALRQITDWFHSFHPARVWKSLVLKTLVSAAD